MGGEIGKKDMEAGGGGGGGGGDFGGMGGIWRGKTGKTSVRARFKGSRPPLCPASPPWFAPTDPLKQSGPECLIRTSGTQGTQT